MKNERYDTSKRSSLLSWFIFLICLAVLTIALFRFNFAREVINGLILDNSDHFLSCAELPSLPAVQHVMDTHQDVVELIRQVKPGSVFVAIDAMTCPGKADIVISYGSHQERMAIEKIIDGDTFFGVPYKMRNI